MPANAFLTSAAIGNREDLVDVIWNTAPSDTPLLSSIDKVDATAVTHEWQRDVLRAPGTASLVAEGADATYTAVTPTQRLSNPCQINRVTFSISDTQEVVKKAGRPSEIRYQTVKQGKELRKDMELAAIENPVFVAAGTRQARGLRGWCATNPGLGAGGVAPNISTNVGPTDGTLRALTEPLLRTAILGAYSNGGDVDMLMVTPSHKQTISTTFTGNGQKFIKGEDRKLQAACFTRLLGLGFVEGLSGSRSLWACRCFTRPLWLGIVEAGCPADPPGRRWRLARPLEPGVVEGR